MTQLANKINKRITRQKLAPIRRLTSGKHLRFVYRWKYKFLPNGEYSHWLLRGHMKSSNETVSRQNL